MHLVFIPVSFITVKLYTFHVYTLFYKLNWCVTISSDENKSNDVEQRLHSFVPELALKYRNETWLLSTQDSTQLQAARMRFLRPVYGHSLNVREEVRSENIRKASTREYD